MAACSQGIGVYSMAGVRRGLMLCVKKGNHGAVRDMDIMRRFFQKYGFMSSSGPLIVPDPTQQDMEMCVHMLRDSIMTSSERTSCLLIAVSCHGFRYSDEKKRWNESVLCDAAGNGVLMSKIIEPFSDANCPKLRGVPKIFIIDACRGEREDFGVLVGARDKKPRGVDSWRDAISYQTQHFSPVISDMVAVYGAIPDYVTLMSQASGGFLIFSIERVFLDNKTKGMHIMDLLLKVKWCFEKINSEYLEYHEPVVNLVLDCSLSKLLYLD